MFDETQTLNAAHKRCEKYQIVGDPMIYSLTDDELIKLIADRFFKNGELTPDQCLEYARIAANVVRINKHLILLRD